MVVLMSQMACGTSLRSLVNAWRMPSLPRRTPAGVTMTASSQRCHGRLLSLPTRPARLVDLNRGQGGAQGAIPRGWILGGEAPAEGTTALPPGHLPALTFAGRAGREGR